MRCRIWVSAAFAPAIAAAGCRWPPAAGIPRRAGGAHPCPQPWPAARRLRLPPRPRGLRHTGNSSPADRSGRGYHAHGRRRQEVQQVHRGGLLLGYVQQQGHNQQQQGPAAHAPGGQDAGAEPRRPAAGASPSQQVPHAAVQQKGGEQSPQPCDADPAEQLSAHQPACQSADEVRQRGGPVEGLPQQVYCRTDGA